MFSPPPSPGIPQTGSQQDDSKQLSLDPNKAAEQHLASSRQELKRRIGRRTRWTIILVPLALILITASTRYITHPIAFDILTDSRSLDWESLISKGSDWSSHERHHHFPRQASGTSSAPPATTAGTAQPLPTIPNSTPTLPTPFPQPFDSDTSKNFSTVSCYNFFANMTNTPAFRSCRPLSLLLQSSSELINAQNNLTLLNSVLWGTCNTSLSPDDCVTNMKWFADQLPGSCQKDLDDKNDKVVNTRIALQAYDVVRQAGCVNDPTTNSYCYLSAVRNPNPADNYFYQLPLGLPLPNSGKPSCSACSKNVMNIYAQALANQTMGPLDGLKKTYNDAAEKAITDCGQTFATLAAGGSSALSVPTTNVLVTVGAALLLAWSAAS